MMMCVVQFSKLERKSLMALRGFKRYVLAYLSFRYGHVEKGLRS
jgi:hypothetical protein